MLEKVYGSAVFGIEATTITVEVNIDKGIGYHLVGLPDNAVRESSYRISAALNNNNFKLPGKKITVLYNHSKGFISYLFRCVTTTFAKTNQQLVLTFNPYFAYTLLYNVSCSY